MNLFPRQTGALAALVFTLSSTPAFAQVDDIVAGADLRDGLRNDIIVTATGARQAIEHSGQAVTVLTRFDIERKQVQIVSDLLATVPGVTVSRNGGPGQPTAVRIRGAEDAQTLVLIDGVRVNDPSSPAGAFDFGNLLTGNIERIEVLRGPNSVPWGSQAIGGVVNIVTAPPGSETLVARGEYGSRDSVALTGRVGGRFGPVAASLGGGYFRDDGVSAYKFGTERDGFRQYAANGRVTVDLGPDAQIDLRGNYADSRVGFDGFPPPAFAFADTNGYSTAKQAFGYAGVNASFGRLKNRLAFTLADTRRRIYSVATGAPSLFNGRIERFEYRGDWQLTEGVRTVFGTEHEFSRFTDATSRSTITIDSGYLQAIVTPVATLTLTGGARVDKHRTYGTEVTFSANAAWRPAPGTVFRASYGEGFKAPTFFQLFSIYGNTGLRPERARSYDLGIEQSVFGGRASVGATAFQRDTTDQIDFFSCFAAAKPLCATRPFGYYDNIARTRTRGVEASVQLRPTDRLSVALAYTLIDAKDRKTGLVLLRRPRNTINASIDWTAPYGLRIGADLRTVSDSRDSDFRTFGPTSLDGYTLGTLRLSLPLGERFELFGRVENAFDTQYETVSGYGVERRAVHVGGRVRF